MVKIIAVETDLDPAITIVELRDNPRGKKKKIIRRKEWGGDREKLNKLVEVHKD